MDVTIAIDAMGGDHGTKVTVPAAVAYLKKHPEDSVVLVGLPDTIEAELAKLGLTDKTRLRIHAA
ncbi:MAG: phosphate acyltransferase, partial [Gallionellaceae bacterium]|nr:phosphate acyltransferase [Gallionellaceae bacterium]